MIEFYSFFIFGGPNWFLGWIFHKNVIIRQNNPNNDFTFPTDIMIKMPLVQPLRQLNVLLSSQH